MHNLSFLVQSTQLKSIDRAGWKRVGIEHPESVAAHSWGVTLLCSLYCPTNLDKERVLQIALVHDLPEIVVGDITPHDGISPTEKHAKEHHAATQLLPSSLLAFWQEYQEHQTEESIFVHSMDKIDMLVQAMTYANTHNKDTSEFINSARKSVHPKYQELVEKIIGMNKDIK